MDDTASLKYLRWRCRRGMQELDVLLVRYLDESYGSAPSRHRGAFVRLLDTPDDVLWDWLSGRRRPGDPELNDVVQSIRATAAR